MKEGMHLCLQFVTEVFDGGDHASRRIDGGEALLRVSAVRFSALNCDACQAVSFAGSRHVERCRFSDDDASWSQAIHCDKVA
jgi:hypothetical protein